MSSELEGKEIEKVVLDVKQIQQLMGIGRRQAYELVNSGQFHTVRVGTSIKVSRKVFEAWLNGEEE